MEARSNVLSSIGVMALLTISSKLVRLIVLMVTARYLTPEDFGIVASFSMVLALAYLIAEIGLNRALIQRPNLTDEHIGSALIISIIFSGFTSIVLIFGSEYIETLAGIKGIKLPLQLSSILFLILSVSNICSAILQRNGHIVFIGKIQSFGTIFGNIFVTVPLLWFDCGYWSIIIGVFVTELISTVVIITKGRGNLKFVFTSNTLIEVFKYSLAFFSHNFITLISKQIDIALVGRFLGKSDLGNYSRAIQLIEFPWQIYWLVVDRVVFPNMSAMASQKKDITNFFINVYSIISVVLCIGALTLFHGANEIINIMMGDNWDIVIVLLEILSINIVFKCLTGLTDSFLSAYGRIKSLTYKNVLSLVIFVILVYIGTFYGLEGVAYSAVLASFINLLLSISLCLRLEEINFKLMISATLPAVYNVLIINTLYFVFSLWLPIGFVSILVAVVFWTCFIFIYPLEEFCTSFGKEFIEKTKIRFNF